MEEAVIKRIPPHNIEAERAVIGSMIMDRDAILVCSEMLTAEDFYQGNMAYFLRHCSICFAVELVQI